MTRARREILSEMTVKWDELAGMFQNVVDDNLRMAKRIKALEDYIKGHIADVDNGIVQVTVR